MAQCPRCHAKQDYRALLFLYGNKTLTCKKCGALLRVNRLRYAPFAILINLVAIIIGLTMMVSGDYLRWAIILLIWLVISMAVFPLALTLRLSIDEDK
jgi:CXXC-20-CXXC protein